MRSRGTDNRVEEIDNDYSDKELVVRQQQKIGTLYGRVSKKGGSEWDVKN